MWKVTAVDSFEFHGQRYNLEVEGPHTYVVDIEGHNCNKNGDAWPKQALENRHNTFVTHGHFFREHRNRDPKKKIGDIKYAAFDGGPGGMHRVELLCWGHKEKAAEEYQMAKEGQELSFSMSARIPEDYCSCCKKASRSPVDYCVHLREHMLQYLPEFKKYAYADNPNPTFFDNSRVRRPADRIAHYLEYRFPDEELRKAASAQSQVILGTDWAEYEGLTLPDHLPPLQLVQRELAEKLAALEQQVEDILLNKQAATDERQRFIKRRRRSGVGTGSHRRPAGAGTSRQTRDPSQGVGQALSPPTLPLLRRLLHRHTDRPGGGPAVLPEGGGYAPSDHAAAYGRCRTGYDRPDVRRQ